MPHGLAWNIVKSRYVALWNLWGARIISINVLLSEINQILFRRGNKGFHSLLLYLPSFHKIGKEDVGTL